MRIPKTSRIYFFKSFGIVAFDMRVSSRYAILPVFTISSPWIDAKNGSPDYFRTVTKEWIMMFSTSSIANSYI